MIDGGLRKIFRANLPHFDWVSIESGLTGSGIPDSNACYNGIEFWVEYKLSQSNKVTLRPDQVGWHMRRSRKGGRTFIAVRFKHSGGIRRGKPMDTLLLYRGRDAKSLAINGLMLDAIGIWMNGPGKWDWDDISQKLLFSN